MKSLGGRSEPLKEGELIEEVVKKTNQPDMIIRYRRGKMLGRGSFGYCYEILNLETNAKSAVKIIPKETLDKSKVKSQVVSEIQIHRELQHENIVRIEQAFEDKQNIYIKMELCLNRNLNGLLKKRKFLTE
jgi:serine/threonine protein kinase